MSNCNRLHGELLLDSSSGSVIRALRAVLKRGVEPQVCIVNSNSSAFQYDIIVI
ncbi:MAG: hypothetical protein WA395_14700 [Nitrososphaeraceae archaeon]